MREQREALEEALSLCTAYLEKLQSRGIGSALTPFEREAQGGYPLRSGPALRSELLSDLRDYLESSVGTLHPGFMNQLFSGLQPWSIAGELAALLTNTTMATYEAAPVATLMERELIVQIGLLVGWRECEGTMVTGGSNANLVGLLMARNRLHPQIRLTGVTPKPLVAYVSEDAHYSFEKAYNILGLGTKNLRKVRCLESGELDTHHLEEMIVADRARGESPFFVGATAGTTVLGAFDPLEKIAFICKRHALWFHVDAAWGGGVLASEKHRDLMRGIHLADSFGWDHHKMLGVGLVSSFFVTPHRGALLESHHGGGADYIFHQNEALSFDAGPRSLQCGRRTDAVRTWFAWKALGVTGMAAYVDQLFANAQAATKLLHSDSRFVLLHSPQSLNICFQLKGVEKKESYVQLRETLMREGSFMVNIAQRRGKSFIRLILAHPQHSPEFVASFLERVAQFSRELECH